MHEQHHHHDTTAAVSSDPPVSVSHIWHIFRSYLPVIWFAMAVVMFTYLVVAMAIYLLAPSRRVTSLPFRLEFRGAERGQYPNGMRFSSAEIISAPVLIKVYQSNDLNRFASFGDFAKAVFVLETNAAQEALAREYQARLNDPKLTPVDRERLQREYELKLSSLNKGQYSLTYIASDETAKIPDVTVRKVLHDILREWSLYISNEQHVLEYHMALLSPSAVMPSAVEGQDPIVATQVLRSKVRQVQSNIANLRALPAAELVRTKKDAMSLYDLDLRLDDIVRFRLDPLVLRLASSGSLQDRAGTLQFLQTQLAHDQRQLQAQERIADAARQTLALYSGRSGGTGDLQEVLTPDSGSKAPPAHTAPSETIMPQFGDTFVDRLMQLATNSADTEYRQALAEKYHSALVSIAPLQQTVAYDQTVVDIVVGARGGGAPVTAAAALQQLQALSIEVHELLTKVHEIHQILSRNLNPATQLLSTAAIPKTRTERNITLRQIILYGVLTALIAFPLIIVFCLLHNRVREEEAAEGYVASSETSAAA